MAIDFAFKKARHVTEKKKLAPFDKIEDSKANEEFEDSWFSDEEAPHQNEMNKSESESVSSPSINKRLLTRKTTMKKESKWSWCCNKKNSRKRRETEYKIFGDRSAMKKVDLFRKNEIIDEAQEKE